LKATADGAWRNETETDGEAAALAVGTGPDSARVGAFAIDRGESVGTERLFVGRTESPGRPTDGRAGAEPFPDVRMTRVGAPAAEAGEEAREAQSRTATARMRGSRNTDPIKGQDAGRPYGTYGENRSRQEPQARGPLGPTP
jgi:hypothetical protein